MIHYSSDNAADSMTVEEVWALLSTYDIKERLKRSVIRSMERGDLLCKELTAALAQGQLPGRVISMEHWYH